MKNIILILIIFLGITGCSQLRIVEIITVVDDDIDVDYPKKLCLAKYDENAYSTLSWAMPTYEQFVYHLYYANRYQYDQAAYFLYVTVNGYFSTLNRIADNADTLYYQPIRMSKECFDFIYSYLDFTKDSNNYGYDWEMTMLYRDGIYLPKDSIMSHYYYFRSKPSKIHDKLALKAWDMTWKYSKGYNSEANEELHKKYDNNGIQALEDIINNGSDEEILIKRLIAYGETALYDSCKTKLGCEGYIYASFLMAYNYHYKPAYKNFAESLLSFYNENHLYVDEKTSQIIEYCMEKGK